MKTTHTPTPWKLETWNEIASNGQVICDVMPSFENRCYKNDKEAEANALHIVKCVNSHDANINAMKQALDVLLKYNQIVDNDRNEAVIALRQALKESEG